MRIFSYGQKNDGQVYFENSTWLCTKTRQTHHQSPTETETPSPCPTLGAYGASIVAPLALDQTEYFGRKPLLCVLYPFV